MNATLQSLYHSVPLLPGTPRHRKRKPLLGAAWPTVFCLLKWFFSYWDDSWTVNLPVEGACHLA